MSVPPLVASFTSTAPKVTSSGLVASSVLDFLFIEIVTASQRLPQSADPDNNDILVDNADAYLRQDTIIQHRLECMGHRIGHSLAIRLSRDHARFLDTLDVIKFVCKDLWSTVFRKQVDNLKTNHRGVFVLSDFSFVGFRRMSVRKELDMMLPYRAQPFTWLPCGIIRGALDALGVEAAVFAETASLPSVTFQIKTMEALRL